MADITWVDVEALAPELSTVPPARQTFILARVNTELSADAWGTLLNTGRVYLAAHLATRSTNGGAASAGPVTSETVGAVSRAYASPSGSAAGSYGSTVYGEEYERLVMSLPTRFALAPPCA